MEMQTVNMHRAIEVRNRRRRAVVACGLWLRAGFIGASALMVGVLQLFFAEVKPLTALALAIAGGVLAAVSWRRARSALDMEDETAAVTDVAPLCETNTLQTAREGAR